MMCVYARPSPSTVFGVVLSHVINNTPPPQFELKDVRVSSTLPLLDHHDFLQFYDQYVRTHLQHERT